MKSCSGRCVDHTKDAVHCGKCNNACRKGWLCSEAYCKCPEGNTICQNAECVSKPEDCPATALQCNCPAPVPVHQCTCRIPLPVTALNSSNGCDSVPCGDKHGSLCFSGGPGEPLCPGYTNQCGPIAYCFYAQTDPNGGGDLCYQTCCDRNGTVHIQGKSISTCAEGGAVASGRCGGNNDLFLYNVSSGLRGELVNGENGEKDVDFTATCTEGQCFMLCELNGVILTDTIKSFMIMTFLGDNACPAGYSQDGTCTIASCDGASGGA